MKFLKRLKQDKKFRIKVVLIAVVILLIYNSGGEDKKAVSQATCDVYNDAFGELQTGKAGACKNSDCAILFEIYSLEELPLYTGDFLQCISTMIGEYPATCSATVIIDKYFMAESESTAYSLCPAGYRPIKAGSYCFQPLYKCIEEDPDKACNSRERSIAGLAQGMGLFKDNCKAAYYTVLIGGAFMAIMMLGVVL